MPLTVTDICMAAPDIISFRVRDGAITKGALVQLSQADGSFPSNNWLSRTNPTTGESEYCKVGGHDGKWLRFADTPSDAFADRAELDNVSNYPTFGGRSVTSVHRITMPYDQGLWTPDGSGTTAVAATAMEHWMFLKLDGNLPQGSYTLSATGNPFPATTFEWDDKRMVSPVIHATQVGHRPGDGNKLAYLSLWIAGYGDEKGAVDYATDYSLDTFYVIDERGAIQHTGSIVERIGPTDLEPDISTIRYVDSTVAPKKITAITKANPGVVTIAGHGFSTGEYKLLSGISGMTQLEQDIVQITVLDADTFSIGQDTTSYGTFSTGTYTTETENLCYDMWQSNRAGTYVYSLDYSSFTPSAEGKYRIYVPGLGVSYPFRIDEAVWLDFAKKCTKAYTAQCWGMPLNWAIAGWNRPANFRDGKEGAEVYESDLPACLENETGMVGGSYAQVAQGHVSPWITANRVADWFGGWSDAGDWDMHLYRHCPSLWGLLEEGFECIGGASSDLGFPRSSKTIGGIYDASTDDLTCVIHMVIWYMEPFRRFQKGDGRVYGGLNYYTSTGNTPGGGSSLFPSFTHSVEAHVLEADHCSTFWYAAVAAKLGRILQEEGYTDLGQTWIDSAEAAWDWAEAIYSDYASSDISGTAFVAHYLTLLDVKTRLSWSDATLKACFDVVQSLAGQVRYLAAACLFRATATTTYSDIVEAAYALTQSGTTGLAAWEYARGTGGNTTQKNYYNGRWHLYPNSLYDEQMTNDSHAYRHGATGDIFWPPAGPGWLSFAFLYASPKDQTSPFIQQIQAQEGFWAGANQISVCMTAGVGSTNPTLLHRDAEAMGLPSSQLVGFTSYGFWWDGTKAIGPNNWEDDSTSNYTAVRLTGSYSSTYGQHKLIEPHPRSVPATQAHWRNTFMIFHTEFVTQQSIVGRIRTALFLHSWDGNTDSTIEGAPISASLSF